MDDLVGLANQLDQTVVFRFKKLQQSPDSNMLEGRVATGQKSSEITMNASRRFCPVLDEDGVIANWFN